MEIEREYAATYVGRIRKYYTWENHKLTDDFGVRVDMDTPTISLYTNNIELHGGNLKALSEFADYIVEPYIESSQIFFGCLQADRVYCDDEELFRFGLAYVFEGESMIFETDLLLTEDDCTNLSIAIKHFIQTNFPDCDKLG